MRPIRSTLTLLCLTVIVGCEEYPAELRLVRPVSPIDQDIAVDMTNLFGQESEVKITLTSKAESEEGALGALINGSADIALVSNNMPFDQDIATIMPLYPTVLHIAYRTGRIATSGEDLIRGAKVFAGLHGSASRLMFERITARLKLEEGDFSYIENVEDAADVAVVFAPLSPDRLSEFPQFRLFSLGPPSSIGQGSLVDAAVLLNPQLRPFVIPVGTYDEATPEPILTLAVDKLLVARHNLDKSIVYDLVNELLRLRPALAAQRPGLFQNLSDDFDASRSTFVLHSGTQAYLQRSAPSVYERYSGLAEVSVTIIFAVFSAVFGGVRIFRMRRKNRLDTFYSKAIAIRKSVDASLGAEERSKAVQQIRDLQNTAFDMLVDEKLAADESFRIFITLSNDVLRQLGATAGESHLSDT